MASYCQYALGVCPCGDNSVQCRKMATVWCRNLRNKNEILEAENGKSGRSEDGSGESGS